MDIGTNLDAASIYISDSVIADLQLGFMTSGGNRHAYCSGYDSLGNPVSVDVIVATDGLEHTLQAVVDGATLQLYMDDVLIASTVAGASLISSFDFVTVDMQRGNLASTTYVSKAQISSCAAAYPTVGYQVLWLLHMDGANNGTVVTDEVVANTWTQSPSNSTPCVTKTSHSKFGGSSLSI